MLSTVARQLILLVLVVLVMTVSGGYAFIPFLRRIKLGQYVREDGPQSHLKKAGTPTMGGVIFLFPFILLGFFSGNSGPVFWATLGCAAIGFADDFIKVVLKRSLGLRAYQKLIAQLAVMIAYFAYQFGRGQLLTQIRIPFTGIFWDLGGLWYVFALLVIFGTTNGANLTDGLDGLSASVSSVMMVFLAVAAFWMGRVEIGVLALIFFAGLLGFLWFNAYPAKVFMGDTGSLAIGGFVAFASIQLQIPLLILLFGIIYLVESLSVMIQVAYFKKTGKRVFKMTPIHHHFELSGVKETKIVAYFTLVTIAASLIALYSIL